MRRTRNVFSRWLAAGALLAFLAAAPAVAQTGSDPLYVYEVRPERVLNLRDGVFGPVAKLQGRIKEILAPVDPALSDVMKVDGEFGPTTAKAVARVQQSAGFEAFAADSSAREVRITAAFWQKLFPDQPLPPVHDRAMTLVLTYEATLFGAPSAWNFCQNPVQGGGGRRQPPCRTNDDSMITWGPRGATFGGGREVQAVVIEAERRNPAVVREAFGMEYDALRRSLALSSKAPTAAADGAARTIENVSDSELYLCSIWIDPARSAAWASAFGRLGRDATVQDVYQDIYASSGFDGGKINDFFSLYRGLGVTPSEIDYAFFVDRATHTSGVSQFGATAQVAARIRADMAGIASPTNWQYRRAIARVMPTVQQRDDRNGRDMAFVVDGAGIDGLTDPERENWTKRFALRASMSGLSDQRTFTFKPDWATYATSIAGNALTPAERASGLCPDWVIGRTKLRS